MPVVIDANGQLGTADTSGNFAIGTTTANAKLTVLAPDTTTGPAFSLRQSNNSAYGYDFDTENIGYGRLDLYGVLNGARTPLVTFKREGNVGIGTLAPNAKLTVLAPDTTTGPAFSLRQSNNSAYGYDFDTENISYGRLNVYGVLAGTRRPLITFRREGGIGIGMQAPTNPLEVWGAARARRRPTRMPRLWRMAATIRMACSGRPRRRVLGRRVLQRGRVGGPVGERWLRGLADRRQRGHRDEDADESLGNGERGVRLGGRGVDQRVQPDAQAEHRRPAAGAGAGGDHRLAPVTYEYKASPGERHVGFIAEDVPELVATQNRKSLSPMDIVAVVTKVVQEQQATIGELKARIAELERQLAGGVKQP